MYTVTEESDLGTNLDNGKYRESGLADLWAKVVSSKKPEMVDFKHYEPSSEAALFIIFGSLFFSLNNINL